MLLYAMRLFSSWCLVPWISHLANIYVSIFKKLFDWWCDNADNDSVHDDGDDNMDPHMMNVITSKS